MLITQGSSAEAAVGMAFVDEVTFQNIIFTSILTRSTNWGYLWEILQLFIVCVTVS